MLSHTRRRKDLNSINELQTVFDDLTQTKLRLTHPVDELYCSRHDFDEPNWHDVTWAIGKEIDDWFDEPNLLLRHLIVP